METQVTGYIIRFNEPDENGLIFHPNCFDTNNLEQLKISGEIIDYSIDNIGVKVIKEHYFKINYFPATPLIFQKELYSKLNHQVAQSQNFLKNFDLAMANNRLHNGSYSN